MNPLLRSIIEKLLGTFIRHGLSALGVWLTAKGIGSLDDGTQNNLTQIIIGGVCVLSGVVWSYARSHISEKKLAEIESVIGTSAQGKSNLLAIPFLAAFAAGLSSCAVVTSFDQNTYDATLSLKAQALDLMARGQENAGKFTPEIEAFKSKLSAQLSYEQGKGKSNVISAKQWSILIDENQNLLGGFLKKWQGGKIFSGPYLIEKRQQVSDAFDQIIRLEGAKRK